MIEDKTSIVEGSLKLFEAENLNSVRLSKIKIFSINIL
jgi:hypothetical protein